MSDIPVANVLISWLQLILANDVYIGKNSTIHASP